MIEQRWFARLLLGSTLAIGSVCYLRPSFGEKRALAASTAPLGGRSLYRLDAAFQTDSGQPFRLPALRGDIQVLALVFTRCPTVCPTLVRELQGLERSLPREAHAATRFTLVSIDPDHDTPAALRAYRAKLGLSPERWQLLRAEPDTVRDLSALLGFSYSSAGNGPLAHSKLVTVLNRDGEIILQQASVNADPDKIIDAIVHAL